MDDMRKKLVELIGSVQYLGGLEEKLADHLIANGITFESDINVGSKWIPVTERLPEKDGKFLTHRLICGGVSTMSVLGFAHNGRKVHEYDLRKKKNVWYDYESEVGYFAITTVTHWMPLPEAPKGDDYE